MKTIKICLLILLMFQLGNTGAATNVIDIATGNGSQTAPVISNQWSAYFERIDKNSKNFVIKVKNLVTDETLKIATADKAYPKFSDPQKTPLNDRFIVWIDYRNQFIESGTNCDVYAYDLVTKKEMRVSASKGKCIDPFLVGNTVYYSQIFSDGVGKHGFYSFDLTSTGTPKLLLEYTTPVSPKCYWDNGYIVWFDWSSNSGKGAIKLYDLANDFFSDIDTHGDTIRQATIQKGYIFTLFMPDGFTFPGIKKISVLDLSETVISEPMQGTSSLLLLYNPGSDYVPVLNVDILFIYNISTGEFTRPDAKKMTFTYGKIVEGDRLVYSTLANQTKYDIWMLDIKNNVSTPLFEGAGNQICPVISGNRVIWWDKAKDEGDIRGVILEGGLK